MFSEHKTEPFLYVKNLQWGQGKLRVVRGALLGQLTLLNCFMYICDAGRGPPELGWHLISFVSHCKLSHSLALQMAEGWFPGIHIWISFSWELFSCS